MLKDDPKSLHLEVRAAESRRDEALKDFDERLGKYTGPWYKGSDGDGTAKFDPENYAYEYMSYIVPRLVFDNPRVRVKTRRVGTQGSAAEAIQHGLNRWVRDENLNETLIAPAQDFLWNFGIMAVSREEGDAEIPKEVREHIKTGRLKTRAKPTDGVELGMVPVARATPSWPTVKRIPQKRYIEDYLASDRSEIRFQGHKWIRDKEDLLDEAAEFPDRGWNTDVIESMATNNARESERNEGANEDAQREEVVGYDIWIPERNKEDGDGYHGRIYTLAVSVGEQGEVSSDFIREDRPFYGPRSGPYVFFGAYDVPDETYSLGPLTATYGQALDLNRHALSLTESAGHYKRGIIVDASKPRLVDAIKNAEHDTVIPIEGFNKDDVMPIEIGGPPQDIATYIQIARDRLDRNLGMSDAQRGNVSGQGTATENQIANESATIRVQFLKRRFEDAVTRLLRKVAWYMYHDDEVVFPLGEEAAQGEGNEPWFVGGNFDPESGATFDDLELEIEAYSMERTTEGLLQKRTMEMVGFIGQVAPLMPQTPFINWAQIFDKLGDSLNMPDLGEMVNTEALMAMAEAQMGEAGPNPKAQPRLGKDVGAARAVAPRRPAPKAPAPMGPQSTAGQQSGPQAASQTGVLNG
jgi:hypothetical protein